MADKAAHTMTRTVDDRVENGFFAKLLDAKTTNWSVYALLNVTFVYNMI